MIDICFSRPVLKNIYIKITNLETNSEYEGEDSIKEALINFIGGDASGGLDIGEDVPYQGIPGILMQVKGVVDFDFQIGLTTQGLGREKIRVGVREKAVTAEDKVVIIK